MHQLRCLPAQSLYHSRVTMPKAACGNAGTKIDISSAFRIKQVGTLALCNRYRCASISRKYMLLYHNKHTLLPYPSFVKCSVLCVRPKPPIMTLDNLC